MRLTFVLLGAVLIERFDWVMPLFGLFLVYTGIKLCLQKEDDFDPENNLLRRLATKVLPVASGDYGERFFVRQDGRFAITPLFLVLLVVESTDVVFAVDSVPAIFGDHPGSVHRLYVEHLRHSGPAGAVFPAGRRDGFVPLFEVRPGGGAGLSGAENDRRIRRRTGFLAAPGPSHLASRLASDYRGNIGRRDRRLGEGRPGDDARTPEAIARRTKRRSGAARTVVPGADSGWA